jgi:acyl-CoA thioesterase FadM
MELEFIGTEEYHFEKNMEFFSALTPIARELGVKIGIENLWHQSPLTNNIYGVTCADPKEHLRYVTSLGAPDVFAACLNVGHTALVDRKPQDAIRILGADVLGALHIHDVDFNGVARASSLMKYIQSAAQTQLTENGMSFDQLRSMNKAFILSKITIEFSETVRAYEPLTATTFPCNSRGYTFLRCYKLERDGITVGRAVAA